MENQGKKGAAVEVYGFVAWLVSFVLFGMFCAFHKDICHHSLLGMYCLWAFLPDSVLHAMGISYYPSKYVFTKSSKTNTNVVKKILGISNPYFYYGPSPLCSTCVYII